METTQDTTAQAANPLERRIDMAVTLADIELEVGQQLKRIAKTAKMAGFRPGKVPMKMVEQMYGGQARSDAIGAAIDKAFGELVRAQNLRIAGQPRVEPRKAADESKPMSPARRLRSPC
jgi:trigger factor